MKIQNVNNQVPKITPDALIPVLSPKTKSWVKPTDQMDSWLDSQGFYRKHIARDASSLFRCVSEKIFLTQVYHLAVRRHCIQFALNNQDVFKKLTDTPIQDYVDRLSNQREWGTKLDMKILSLIYNVDFFMYKEKGVPSERVTANNHGSCIVLSLSLEHHYDSVYPKQHIMNTAICQSIFYEMLYKCVFKLEEVDYAVSRMLHDKMARYNTDLGVAYYSTGFQMRLEMRDNCKNVKDLLNCGITPFPYKVAKSLDPNIYRNVEYDTWNEQRKGMRHGLVLWNNRELQVGSRCIINFNEQNSVIRRHGYIQQMSPDKGPVLVFIEELGKKLTVPFESLEVLPQGKHSEENVDYHSEASSNESNSNLKHVDVSSEADAFSPKGKPENRTGSHSQLSELCSTHYVHSASTVVSSTCSACSSSSSNNIIEQTNHMKSSQVLQHSNFVEDHSKASYNVPSNSNQIPVSYQVPVYPVVPQEAQFSQPMVPAPMQTKQPNSGDFVDGSIRLMYSPNADPYYRFAFPNYPYYVVTPNYTLPSTADHTAQPNTDVTRSNYSPASYSVPAVPNELYYPMPISNVPNKVEYPLYSTQLVYPSYVKKTNRNITSTPEYANVESVYRPKDMMCIKDSIPLASPTLSTFPSNVYGVTTYPPVYYHSYDYCGTCPEMQSYEGVTSVYPPPQLVPMTYSEDMYQSNGQVLCQPILPSHSQ